MPGKILAARPLHTIGGRPTFIPANLAAPHKFVENLREHICGVRAEVFRGALCGGGARIPNIGAKRGINGFLETLSNAVGISPNPQAAPLSSASLTEK